MFSAYLSKTTMKDEKQPLLVATSVVDVGDGPLSAEAFDHPKTSPSESAEDDSKKGGTYHPMMDRDLEHPTSNTDTLIHLLKGNVGTGILAMPDAFKNAGLAVGFFGTLLMGAVCTHCMHMLVNCAHELCLRSRSPSLGFSDVVYCAFDTGPIRLRPYANVMRNMVSIFLVITQLGFCCVYFVFVAANLHSIMEPVFGHNIGLTWYLCMILVPMIGLNLVKNLKFLTPVSLVAAIMTVCGLAITFYYMLHDLPRTSTVHAFASWGSLPLYFGTAIYAFEGIGVVLPLENNMQNPQDFGGWNGVLNTGMVIVASLYTAVGFFGYLKYGDSVKGSITLNLPPHEFMAQTVRVVMAAAIFLSYGLQFYVPMNVIWPVIKERLNSEVALRHGENVTRIVLIMFTFILAAIVPNLGAVISLVGAVSSSTLALIFPPLIEIITFWPDNLGHNNWILWKDITITMFGITGFIFGTYVSVENIILGTST